MKFHIFKIDKDKEKVYLKIVVGLIVCVALIIISYHVSKLITYNMTMSNYISSIE